MERFDRNEDAKYRRIYGAVAWPGKRPGFAVIIGQNKNYRLGGYDLIFLDEIEESDMRKLVRACGGFDFFYRPDVWIGDTKNDAGDKFIREMNAENRIYGKGREGARMFKMRRSPLLDMKKNSFAYFFPAIKELLYPDRRRLYLKDGSKLKDYMFMPQASDLTTIEFGDYPAIEALAFAALELERSTDTQRHRQQKKYAVNNYSR